MDFEKRCMLFTMQEPYYGILLSSMNRVPTSKTDTMGVGVSGNVFRLYYNPDFVDKLDVDTTLEILKHETLHVAFDSWSPWETEAKTQGEQTMRNIAADMEINSYINVDKMKGTDIVLAKQFGWEDKLGTREYYRRLKDMANQMQQQTAQSPSQPCNGGQGGQSSDDGQEASGNQQQPQQNGNGNPSQDSSQPSPGSGQGTGSSSGSGSSQSQSQMSQNELPSSMKEQLKSFDDHSNWPDDDDEYDHDLTKQMVEDLLLFAADEVEKAQGSVPAELKGRIDGLRKRRPRPVCDWKRYFRRYLGNEFTEMIRKSKKRESRRFPDAAGNRHRRKSHILVAIDTSGSVSMPEYREFFGQIRTLTSTADFHVVECDARIAHEYDFRGRIQETLHGGGGTSFQPPVDMFNENRRKYDALVYFTDGYAPIPKDTPKDTLWVISSEGDHDRKRYKVNGASVVFIPAKVN